MIMKKIILFISILLVSTSCYADTISSGSGTFSSGETYTLTGTFTDKSIAAPLTWDNCEAFSDEDDVNLFGWGRTNGIGAAYNPEYNSDNQRTNSTRNIYSNNTNENYNSSFWRYDSGGYQKIYVSYWYKGVTTGSASTNTKPFGLRGGGDGVLGYPQGRMDFYPSSSTGSIYINDNNQQEAGIDYSMGNDLAADGTWRRREMYIDWGSEDTADGIYYYWRDCVLKGSITEEIFKTDSTLPTNCFINMYFDTGGTASAQFWFDDIYIDNLQQRVELGDNATYSSCTHREVQTASSWGTGSIEITANPGSFATDDTAYLFVIDSDGNVSNALEVTIGSGGGTVIPTGTTTISGTPAPGEQVAWSGTYKQGEQVVISGR